MTITIVSFKAFSHDMQEAYINKTLGQIHRDLKDKCDTYQPTAIHVAEIQDQQLKEVNVEQLLMLKESWEKIFTGADPEKLGQFDYLVEYMTKNFEPPKRKI